MLHHFKSPTDLVRANETTFSILPFFQLFAKTNLIIFVVVLVALGFDFVNFFVQTEKEISPPTSNTLVNQSSYLHYTSWSINTLLDNRQVMCGGGNLIQWQE